MSDTIDDCSQMVRTMHYDYETWSTVDIAKCGHFRYAEEAEILLVAYSFDDGPTTVVDVAQGEPYPAEFMDALLDPTIQLYAHNASFERVITEQCLGIEVPIERFRCTSVWAASLGLPASLGPLSELLGLGDKGKLATGKALIKKFCCPCKPTKKNGQRVRNLPHHFPEDWQTFKEYCIQDVIAEKEVHRRLAPYPMPDSEWALYALDQRINSRGVQVDIKLVTNAIATAADVKAALMARATEITQLANANSRAQLIAWLNEEDVFTTTLTKKDVEQLLGSTDNEKVIELLELRQKMAKSSVSKYAALARAVCKDGRLRGALKFNGAGRTARWAGQIFQPQNLPSKGLIPDIPLARGLLLNDPDLIPMIYDSVPQALSSLIRPALIAKPGYTFVVIDFSAIEARVLAWLSNEQWRLDLFAVGGKLYETSAEKMFRLPPGSVTKKDPNRQKGKVAELALGYQGWEGALITMGALDMGLQLEELAPIATAWRAANPAIEAYWYACEKAVIQAVQSRSEVTVVSDYQPHGLVKYSCDGKFLFCHLPSGRKMAYAQPSLGTNDRGRLAVRYKGIEGKSKAWLPRWLYGGLLCIAKSTPVLTARGWVAIETVTATDLVWDGEEFVNTKGAVFKGHSKVIKAHGAWMTEDHKVLTEGGWQSASQSERFDRAPCRIPDGYTERRVRWQEDPMAGTLRLRNGDRDAWNGVVKAGQTERGQGLLRMSEERFSKLNEADPRNVRPSGLLGVAEHARSLSTSLASSLAELWRTGHRGLQAVGRELRGFLGGYGVFILSGVDTGEVGQFQRVQPGELYLDNNKSPEQQQAKQRKDKGPHCDRVDEGDRIEANNAYVPISSAVFDLIDCGPRNRFVIATEGLPLIVHNCENQCQAVARDYLAAALLATEEVWPEIVLHVHDEEIVEVPKDQAEHALHDLEEILSREMPWGKGLLMKGDGYITKYYVKDED